MITAVTSWAWLSDTLNTMVARIMFITIQKEIKTCIDKIFIFYPNSTKNSSNFHPKNDRKKVFKATDEIRGNKTFFSTFLPYFDILLIKPRHPFRRDDENNKNLMKYRLTRTKGQRFVTLKVLVHDTKYRISDAIYHSN